VHVSAVPDGDSGQEFVTAGDGGGIERTVSEAASPGGVSVRFAVCMTPAYVPVIVAVVLVVTAVVVIVKFADVAPAGIVTDAGTVACVRLLLSMTTAPPAVAGNVNVAVP